MPRAYTKSGSIEKYESAQWATPVWTGSATGTVTGPDRNGNYTVNAPSDYSTTVTSNASTTCTTNYAGVTATFTFYSIYSGGGGDNRIPISFNGPILKFTSGRNEDKFANYSLSIPANCKAKIEVYNPEPSSNYYVNISPDEVTTKQSTISIDVSYAKVMTDYVLKVKITVTCTGGTEYPVGNYNTLIRNIANVT